MEFTFGFLKFRTDGKKVRLCAVDGSDSAGIFTEVNVAGENRDSHFGNKMICSSESAALEYVSHHFSKDSLVIVQRSGLVETRTHFACSGNTVSVYTEVENISDGALVLDEVSSFVYSGFLGGAENSAEIEFYRFLQSHHGECQPRKAFLYDLGLFKTRPTSQKRIFCSNVGSWSTKEELPQGILSYRGKYAMFQIESNHSWYYEISDNGSIYLYLGGANGTFGGWYKKLMPAESYRTVKVAISVSDSLNGVIGEMTKYRRAIRGTNRADENLPVIFNEYMHLSWESPAEENTWKYLSETASFNVKYYVIDCGWHDDVSGDEIYPRVGAWKESRTKFPHGIRAVTDAVRSLGMKAGLWIEPEVVGYQCEEMLAYYDEDCFLHRYGKKICTMGRYFLNFRNTKVVDYLTDTIRRMVEEYGAEYIKMDYNQDMGIGTGAEGESLGEGLEEDRKAYLEWIDAIRAAYPEVLIETCSSGGMRMDYETLKHFSIVSTSDQIDYKKYPYIAGNILSAVLPEQAAVWSYPVAGNGGPEDLFAPDESWVEKNIGKEQIVMNMINSFMGRMHLASRIGLLSEEKKELIKEGIACYDKLTPLKKRALPCFPLGFADFEKKTVAGGFTADGILYLAVWNLGGEKVTEIPLDETILSASVEYPKNMPSDFSVSGNTLTVRFAEEFAARFFEIKLKREDA